MADQNTDNKEINVTPETQPEPNTPTIEDLTKQIATLTATLAKQKKAIDAASSDAAEWKRKYNSTLDEATRKENDRKEAEAAKDARIAQLERDRDLDQRTAAYMAAGYDADLARKSAEAYTDGDFAKVLDLQKQHQTKIEADLKARLINQQPTLTPGQTPSGAFGDDPKLAAFKRGARGI